MSQNETQTNSDPRPSEIGIHLNLDTASYPPFITRQWLQEQTGFCRVTINEYVIAGSLPPFSTPPGSSRQGWWRETFVSFLAGKGMTEGRLAAASGIYATAG